MIIRADYFDTPRVGEDVWMDIPHSRYDVVELFMDMDDGTGRWIVKTSDGYLIILDREDWHYEKPKFSFYCKRCGVQFRSDISPLEFGCICKWCGSEYQDYFDGREEDRTRETNAFKGIVI